MNINNNYALYALVAANAVLLFGAAIALLRFERLVRSKLRFWDGPVSVPVDTAKATQTSNAVLSAFLDRRLSTVHDRLDMLAGKIESNTTTPAADMPYIHATRMARNGASIGDLVRACGLSKAEARLMRRLHAEHSKIPPVAH